VNFKQILLVLFATCITVAYAQDRKFNFGVSLFPNLSFGIISNDGSVTSGVENGFKSLEVSQICYSAGFFTEYKLGKKSALGFGLGLQKNGESTGKREAYFEFDPQTGEPIYGPYDPRFIKFDYNRYNAEIPLYYKLNFGKRSYFVVGTSLFFNIINTTRSVLYFETEKKRNTSIDNTTDYRFLNFSGNIGYGFDFLRKENFNLFFQPYAQYGILGVSESAPLNRNFLSIGFVTGIKF
jgi:hypothetical protein